MILYIKPNVPLLGRYYDFIMASKYCLLIKPIDAATEKRRTEIDVLMATDSYAVGLGEKYFKDLQTFYKGCRGEYNKTSKLYCVYNHENTDFLKLAPLKLEILNEDPYMVLYHDVLNDEEIKHMQEIARPSMQRAAVTGQGNRRNVVHKHRTAETTWCTDNASHITQRLHRRITDMTGFDLNGAEELQPINYIWGGHYGAHIDCFNLSKVSCNL